MQSHSVVAELFAQRHSCRAFDSRPVDRAVIEELFRLAQRSPSWCNTQPWQVHVTEGAGTERLRAVINAYASAGALVPDLPFPRSYSGAHAQRRRDCAWQLYDAVGVEHGDRAASASQAARNFVLFGAPHVAVVSTSAELGVYGALDCGVYLGHLLVAAQSLGIATVAQAALAAVAPVVRAEFGLGDDRQVLFGISFGYPDTAHPANAFRTTRADLAEVLTWVG